VDDLRLAEDSKEGMIELKHDLGSCFELVDLGPIHLLLSIKLECNRKTCTLSLSQSTDIEKMLERFNLTNTHPISIPLAPGSPLTNA
jgi:hypothetical protein